MSWNRNNSKSQRGAAAARKPRVPPVLLVLLVLLVLAACVWWAVRQGGGAAPKPKAPRAGGKIAEATPAAAPRTAQAERRETTKEEKRLAEIRRYEEKYGTNMPPGIKARVYFLKNPPETVYRIQNRYSYLRHPAERQIASLLEVEPGAFMLDRLEFGESFNRDFLAAMLDGSKPLPDDDDETRAVKEAVAETIQDMAALRKSEGKLPSEILNEHAGVLYELGQFEKDLEDELLKAKSDPEKSDDEVRDLFAAANVLRKKRGLPEWKVPDFSKRSIRLHRKLKRKETGK
ncbi:MAG: hypothetical protein IJG84_14900 [Kiritimatiellae bacterium]|nr:hypothetical protein [Kiritimatiellia bacterium]